MEQENHLDGVILNQLITYAVVIRFKIGTIEQGLRWLSLLKNLVFWTNFILSDIQHNYVHSGQNALIMSDEVVSHEASPLHVGTNPTDL